MILTTNAEIDAAIKRGKRLPKTVDAIAARYILETDQIAVSFENGIEVRFPRKSLRGLENATSAQISNITIDVGNWLLWPDLDVDHYLPQLMDGFASSCRIMAELGRRGGAKKSPVKTAAVRENGKKGGRPRTKPPAKKPAPRNALVMGAGK
jgi:hypothetical protein